MNGAATSELDAAVAQLRAQEEGIVGCRGLEGLVAGATLAVPKRTWLLPGRRERACALLRGCAPDRLDAARPYRVVPPGSSPVARAAEAVGMALAGDPALVWLGTGSVSYGAFTEALALAAAHRAPVLFVVSWYVNEGPFAPQLPVSPGELATTLGLPAVTVEGADAGAVYAAVTRLSALGGPGLLEGRLYGNTGALVAP